MSFNSPSKRKLFFTPSTKPKTAIGQPMSTLEKLEKIRSTPTKSYKREKAEVKAEPEKEVKTPTVKVSKSEPKSISCSTVVKPAEQEWKVSDQEEEAFVKESLKVITDSTERCTSRLLELAKKMSSNVSALERVQSEALHHQHKLSEVLN